MPRGRSTFTKRQKEQARQQKQRDKAERRNQRKQEKTEGSVDEMRALREHAEAQAALFRVGSDETNSAEPSTEDESRDIAQSGRARELTGVCRKTSDCGESAP